MSTDPNPTRPEVDDPRILALAKARQQMAHRNPFNFVCPPWGGLSSDEQQSSLLDARNYLRAAIDAGLVAAAAQPTSQTGLRDRIAEAIHSDLTAHKVRRDQGLLGIVPRLTDVVLSVLPPPEDQAALERVRALHQPIAGDGGPYCETCTQEERQPAPVGWWVPYPCPTVQVLDEELHRLAAEAPEPATQAEALVDRREAVLYFLESRVSGGKWESSSSATDDLAEAARQLARRRDLVPDVEYRLAQHMTTVTVQPLPVCLDCRHWRCDGDGPCGALLDAWQRCTCTGPDPAAVPAVGQTDEEA